MTRITDPKILAERGRMLDRKIMEDIEKHGWSDMAIFPTSDDPGLYFNYTVGLAERNHPDLIVVGMPPETGHYTLSSAYTAIVGGYTFQPDTYATNVLEGLRVAILEVVDPLNNGVPMTKVKQLYGEVHGLQIVWPDTNDRFPWDDEFEEHFRAAQPLLGTWSGP